MIPNLKYKTNLCKYWQSKGTCPHGARCHYAHGEAELRAPTDVN